MEHKFLTCILNFNFRINYDEIKFWNWALNLNF